MTELLYTISVWLLPLVFAITFHEVAHGWVAGRLGDDTAMRAGRVTLNPLKHVDNFGTLMLPGLLILVSAPFVFGYAKPVPVNFARLNNPKRDMVWVALAGPAMNIALAIVAGLLFHLRPFFPAFASPWILDNLDHMLLINVILAVFNMLPLPPLDGGRVLVGILPRPLAVRVARVERYGMLLLIGVLFIVPTVSSYLGYPFSPLVWLMGTPIELTFDFILAVSGHG